MRVVTPRKILDLMHYLFAMYAHRASSVNVIISRALITVLSDGHTALKYGRTTEVSRSNKESSLSMLQFNLTKNLLPVAILFIKFSCW